MRRLRILGCQQLITEGEEQKRCGAKAECMCTKGIMYCSAHHHEGDCCRFKLEAVR